MSYSPEQILKKVQKLLKLANNAGATEGERDNALRMAHKFLAKHNLDMSDIESANKDDKKKASGEPREENVATFYGRPWARNVCSTIAKLFFCYYLYTSHKKATQVRHYFIGRKSNTVTAALMAEFVVRSIMREGNRQKREEHQGNAWLRTFCWGAAGRIGERVDSLMKSQDESQKGAEAGTALVLASYYQTERKENELMVAALYPKLGKGRGGKGHQGGDAYSRGRSYGGSVSLNTQLN